MNIPNPITTIKDSRFSHYLIDHEFILEIKMYENMFIELQGISKRIDEAIKQEKQRRRKMWVIRIVGTIIGIYIGYRYGHLIL